MFVCVCYAVREAEVREAVRLGALEVEDVSEALGAGAGCGTCREAVQSLIDANAEAATRRLRLELSDSQPALVACRS